MTELHDPTREALAQVVQGLVERHGGPSKVGTAVGAHRLTVTRWMKGDIGIDKLGLLAEKLGEPIVVRFGPDAGNSPGQSFDWSGLMDTLDSVAVKVLALTPEEARERKAARLLRDEPQTAPPSPTPGGSSGGRNP